MTEYHQSVFKKCFSNCTWTIKNDHQWTLGHAGCSDRGSLPVAVTLIYNPNLLCVDVSDHEGNGFHGAEQTCQHIKDVVKYLKSVDGSFTDVGLATDDEPKLRKVTRLYRDHGGIAHGIASHGVNSALDA